MNIYLKRNTVYGEVRRLSELHEYKCPNCDGGIEFDSASQNMKCPYCGSEFDVEALKDHDERLKNADTVEGEWQTESSNEWSGEEAENLRSYVCNTCAGEIITDATTSATSCPYCGNPVIMMDRFSGQLRPDYVIPFKLDKKAAKEGLQKHLSGKVLLPKSFKNQNRIEEIKGIYVPFWIFDSDVDADLQYRGTKVRHWSDSRYNYTETSHYSIVRAGDIAFEHIPVDGSQKMADDIMESIEPYNFDEAVDFATAYLSGYFADKYDVTASQCIDRINQRVRKSTEQAFASTVMGYTSVVPENSNIRINNGKAKYALYPVWLLNTVWQGKTYTFAMNGQTGKFVGDLPMDKAAYWRWFFGVAAACTAVIFAVGKYLLM